MSGIAMRAQASGNSSVPAMSFVFSYGGAMVSDNKAVFASPEAIAAIEMYGQLLSQAGSRGVSGYEWYHVLDDFLQRKTGDGDRQQQLRDRHLQSGKKSRCRTGPVCRLSTSPRSRRPCPSCRTGRRASIPGHETSERHSCFCCGRQASRPRCGPAAAGLATTRLSAWSSESFKKAFGAQAAEAALTNLQNADVDRAKAILFHPQSRPILDAFMIGVNEVVSGANTAKVAMTNAAAKANAAIRG
jgi:multiple sugar transport system substrate-binding protein